VAFGKPKTSSTARGYDSHHRRERARLVAAFTPGDPCCLCHHPMYGPTRNLDADHLPGTRTYRGLAHGHGPCQTCGRRCNRSDGASRGARITNAARKATRTRSTSRIWR
jgi:hypothetical protein